MDKIGTYVETIKTSLIFYIPKVLLAVAILWIGFKAIKKIEKIVDVSLEKVNISDTMRPFLNSLLSTVLKIVLILVAVSILGVELSGLVTIVAAMGFAIGLSLQGSLGNFASGILILFLKPYKSGDWIQVDDKFGKVNEIGIFNTIMTTPGNKLLIVPNSKITDDVVTNFSTKGVVRLELNAHIPYNQDFPFVKEIILRELQGLSSVLKDPVPEIGIDNFDTHNIQLAVRPFVHPDNYWKATFETHEAIKKAFCDNNIKVAYSEGIELGDIGA